ncbi:hypothetical protein [Sorangium sp. So ce854]|uniref:hypothetical protein n=1 Tax=Sorangium sp. So ce854 TaxID=3133322 RepID=UPI003F5FD278
MTTKSPVYTQPHPDAPNHLLSVDPASSPSKDDVLGWLMAEINLPRVAGALETARSVNSWLYSFWLKVHEGELSPGEALAEATIAHLAAGVVQRRRAITPRARAAAGRRRRSAQPPRRRAPPRAHALRLPIAPSRVPRRLGGRTLAA